MTQTSKKFYITTAISYVNGAPHLGHAYEAILTDCIARFKRADGYDVKFLTGTDEHGQKVAQTAAKHDMGTKEFCDQNAALFEGMTEWLNLSNDDFIRTTEPRHYHAAQELWRKMLAKGDIYKSSYAGWYSVREEGYFDEVELVKNPDTGEKMTPNGTEVEWVEESSYFFRLSEYADKLLAHYEAHPGFIYPESRRNEIVSFVKSGLRDLSISRTLMKWGVPVPDDEDHVMYVWVDALTNYITGVGYPDTQSEEYQHYWPADMHVIGKDITRFHAVYWPAFLMSAELALPKCVFGHGFINIDGQKMSKSLGNVIAPKALVEEFGLDQTRYLLMREIPHGGDGNFSAPHAVARINADLANGLGNLAQRSLSMIQKNCEGLVPEKGRLLEADIALLNASYDVINKVRYQVDQFKYHIALEEIWAIVDLANAYIDEQAPWKLKKEDPDRMHSVLYTLAESIRNLGIIVQWVMPESSSKILDQLSVKAEQRGFMHLNQDYALISGEKLPEPKGVFPRLEIEEAAA